MKNTSQERTIESFELSANYYTETFICGKKKHVLDEIKELFIYSPAMAITILSHIANNNLDIYNWITTKILDDSNFSCKIRFIK
jgi:hypothetical protein